jgi:hypothetical protein
MGALSLLFFSQKVVLGGVGFFLFSVPKNVGFGLVARPNIIRSG